MPSNVLNRFEQADSVGDNPLILGGTTETPGGNSPLTMDLVVMFSDIIAAAQSVFVFPNTSGKIVTISGVADGDPSSGETTVTAKINNVLVDGNMVFAAGDPLGAGKSFSPTSSNTLSAGQSIEILHNAGALSAGVIPATITIEVEQD